MLYHPRKTPSSPHGQSPPPSVPGSESQSLPPPVPGSESGEVSVGNRRRGFLTDYDYASRLVFADKAEDISIQRKHTLVSASKADDISAQRQRTVCYCSFSLSI